jgi:probable F420-dependent oxidoreductase
MHVGVFTMNPPAAMRPDALAREVESRGLDSLWFGEHSHIPVDGTLYPAGGELPDPYKTMPDLFVWLTAAAMATTRIQLGTGVLLPLERDPFHAAKAIASLDLISGGRVVVGVGVGWNEVEFRNHTDIPWSKRYLALRESVAAMRALWSQEQASFKGEFYRFEPVLSYPKPLQKPGPKIAVGAAKKLGVAHTAQWGDIWYPLVESLRDPAVAVARFRDACREAGRADEVSITFSALKPPAYDDAARYRDLGAAGMVFKPHVDEGDHDGLRRALDQYAELKRRLG